MSQALPAKILVWVISLVASLPIAALAETFDEGAFVGSERLRVYDQDIRMQGVDDLVKAGGLHALTTLKYMWVAERNADVREHIVRRLVEKRERAHIADAEFPKFWLETLALFSRQECARRIDELQRLNVIAQSSDVACRQDATGRSGSDAAANDNSGISRSNQETSMFGLIGQLKAKPGQGEALARILAQGSKNMPGNIAYLVAVDATDTDIIWVTEVWESAEDHKNSLTLESVREAITKGKPLIEEFIASHPVSPIP